MNSCSKAIKCEQRFYSAEYTSDQLEIKKLKYHGDYLSFVIVNKSASFIYLALPMTINKGKEHSNWFIANDGVFTTSVEIDMELMIIDPHAKRKFSLEALDHDSANFKWISIYLIYAIGATRSFTKEEITNISFLEYNEDSLHEAIWVLENCR